MFKKYFFTAILFSMLTGSLIAEEFPEPILECDEKFDKCADKCGESSSDACFEQCEEKSDHCYKTYVYEDGSVPTVKD